MIKKVFFLIIILLIVFYNATVLYVDKNMRSRQHANIYDSCHKVWSSRGFYKSLEERNSITSMQSAFSLGYIGAEVDLFYDVTTDRFIISHDRPKKLENGDLIYSKKDGSILTLEKFLKVVGKEHYFWLDYKNLGRISDENTDKAIARLLEISEFDSIRERLYIEGSNPARLSMYTNAGFRTIFGIHPLYESSILSSFVARTYKIAYYFNNISALAINYGLLDDPNYGLDTQNILKGIPAFIFHIPNNEKLLNNLLVNKDARVLLVDGAIKINRSGINLCKGNADQ